MSVSVVMVSYNTGPILFRAMEAVLTQDHLSELIIVDNGNPEHVRTRLDALAKENIKLTVLRGHGNIGFAAACNLGARRAKGTYVLLLNPDCVIPAGALKKSVAALENEPAAWLAGIHMVDADGKPQGGCKRNLLTPRIAMSEVFQLWRVLPKAFPRLNLDDAPGAKEPEIVPAISGAFMLIRTDHYNQLGGIDEDYFFHVEDLDFCLLVNKAGGKVLYLPGINSIHFRSTSKVSSLFVEWNKAKGFAHYFAKHFKDRYGIGFSLLAMAGIYMRLGVRAGIITLKEIIEKLQGRRFGRRQLLRLKWLEAAPLPEEKPSEKLDYQAPYLIIGSTGQVGVAILRRLLAAGQPVAALYHNTTVEYSHPNLQWIQGSLEADILPLGDFNPHTVICTASIWMLPKHLDALAARGVKRLICFSSTSLISKAASTNPYEKKLVQDFKNAEESLLKACQHHGIGCTIFRPTMIYGLGLDRNVTTILGQMQKYGFQPLMPPASGMRQPVHCFDLAAAVTAAIPNHDTYDKSYTLSGSEKITYLQMVERIRDTAGVKARIVFTSHLPRLLSIYAFVLRHKELNAEMARRMNENLAFDSEMAAKDFGYTPRAFLAGGKRDLGLEDPPLPVANLPSKKVAA